MWTPPPVEKTPGTRPTASGIDSMPVGFAEHWVLVILIGFVDRSTRNTSCSWLIDKAGGWEGKMLSNVWSWGWDCWCDDASAAPRGRKFWMLGRGPNDAGWLELTFLAVRLTLPLAITFRPLFPTPRPFSICSSFNRTGLRMCPFSETGSDSSIFKPRSPCLPTISADCAC